MNFLLTGPTFHGSEGLNEVLAELSWKQLAEGFLIALLLMLVIIAVSTAIL